MKMSQAVADELERWAKHLRSGTEVSVNPWVPTSEGAQQKIMFSIDNEMITIQCDNRRITSCKVDPHVPEQ